ncbi:unnamed protein product [Schistosoma curassoni]|uniref:Guanylate kinase n=1 Tax=Schistosoma curassoni TaxID=6186 RepID=A0A183KV56_9TREM|nr:unnamed protein product [Schistosoma curassoni]
MRSKVGLLAGSLSKRYDLRQEIMTLSPHKLLLSKDMVPEELDDIIKVQPVVDFIANEVTKQMISLNNVIIYIIPEMITLKSVRNSILKAANLQDSQCQFIRLNKMHQKYS